MRKGHNREKKKKNGKKIMMFTVATNVVASRPPERRPTGMLHAPAKINFDGWVGGWVGGPLKN